VPFGKKPVWSLGGEIIFLILLITYGDSEGDKFYLI
jgi:hypothetical protein